LHLFFLRVSERFNFNSLNFLFIYLFVFKINLFIKE